jgi:hypothetical protein
MFIRRGIMLKARRYPAARSLTFIKVSTAVQTKWIDAFCDQHPCWSKPRTVSTIFRR